VLYTVSRFFIILFGKIFFRLAARGKANIPKDGAFILASNHVSNLDPLMLGAACSRKLGYMSKEELFKNPLLAFWLRNVNAFPVKRQVHDVGAIREALKKLKGGEPLLMFPEGGRSLDGEFSDAQPGVGMLAMHTSVPILPAFIKGSKKAMAKGEHKIRFNKIVVIFGKKFYLDKNQTYEEAANYIKNEIIALGESA